MNDVALAVVAGALRQLALLRRVAPAPVKVMVPVSRRGEDEMADMGNRIAFVFITLPVHLRDPLARLRAICDETAAFKESERASGGEALMSGLGLLPRPLQAPVARYAASPRMYNLVVSNVPGPRMPVYLLGAECVEVLPAIPLSEGHALSVGVFTLRDRVCFGVYADPEALPQVGELPGRSERGDARAQRDRGAAEPAPAEAEGGGGRDEDRQADRRPELSGGVEDARRDALSLVADAGLGGGDAGDAEPGAHDHEGGEQRGAEREERAAGGDPREAGRHRARHLRRRERAGDHGDVERGEDEPVGGVRAGAPPGTSRARWCR